MDTVFEEKNNLHFYAADSEKILMVMPHPSTIYVNGIINIEVLVGSVEIMGYVLRPGKNIQTVYSPRGTSLLNITTIDTNVTDDLPALVSKIIKTNVDKVVLSLSKNMRGRELMTFLKMYIPYQLFPRTKECSLDVEKRLKCLFETSEVCYKHFIISEEWTAFVERINSQRIKDKFPKVVLCGGKNVGKSSMLRYMINTLLNYQKEVLVLDFDPGQAEFTVMGCVSAVVVRSPLLGPNFTHISTPVVTYYLNSISVDKCLDMYYAAVNNVIQTCEECLQYRNVVWIVNTMGYTKGIGKQIISRVIQRVKPTDVVQINSMKADNNFDCLLTPNNIRESALSPLATSALLTYKLHLLASLSDDFVPSSVVVPGTMNAVLKRDTVTAAYFFNILSADQRYLNSVTPYRIDVRNFTIRSSSEQDLSLEDTLRVLNANMVALCATTGHESLLKLVGFGIVRAVDLGSSSAYIITPIEETSLRSVNVICISVHISLPESIYLAQRNFAPFVPYVDSIEGYMNSYMRRKPRLHAVHTSKPGE